MAEVIQSDRDAAIEWLHDKIPNRREISLLAEAFARHRIEAEKRTAPRSVVEVPKPLPEGARGPFAVNCGTGDWFYVNHGFTWQGMPSPIDAQPTDFQSRVAGWMLDCFTHEIAADKLERADRFCEEALELVQTMPDFTKDRAHALVDYVFSREVGERGQEVGGVMVTLAALCGPCDLDMAAEAEREYARISAPAVIEKIRAKHASKPTGSALPIPQPSLTTDDALDYEELSVRHGQNVEITFRNEEDAFALFNELKARGKAGRMNKRHSDDALVDASGTTRSCQQQDLTTEKRDQNALVERRNAFVRAISFIEHDVGVHELTGDEIDRILAALEGDE